MRFFWVPACALGVLACGGTDLPAPGPDAATPSGDVGVPSVTPDQHDAGLPEEAGPGPTDAGEGSGEGGASSDAGKQTVLPPDGQSGAGTPVRDPAAPGAGPCAGKTLASVIAAVHEGWPDLAGISAIAGMDPNLSGDGSLIFAFSAEGGFRVVFKRGMNDCPAGCIDNRYWYFETDKQCAPRLLGEYERTYSGAGNCFEVKGRPLWGIPAAIDPMHVCGADNSPKDIHGIYRLRGAGNRTACTEKMGAEPTEKVSLELTATVLQAMGDLASGTVVLQGSGNPRLDGVPLPGTVKGRKITAALETSNLPAMCVEQSSVSLELDLAAPLSGKLSFFEMRSIGCPPGTGYCKGALTLELSERK
jgi:hypothetical protein